MENQQNIIQYLSPHLFWDVAIKEIDKEQHRTFILERVMRYGRLNDWLVLKRLYGLPEIKAIALDARDLDDFSIAFLSLIFNIKKEDFRCYKQKQLQPSFWNY